MIQLSEQHLEAIRQHGAQAFPHECVGVLLGTLDNAANGSPGVKVVHEVRSLDNTFAPNEAFERSVFSSEEAQDIPQTIETIGQERRYLISPDTMFRLMQEERRTKQKVLGFYHSHPDHPAQPSVYDREWASPWYTYIIVSILGGKPDALTAWQLADDRASFYSEDIENP